MKAMPLSAAQWDAVTAQPAVVEITAAPVQAFVRFSPVNFMRPLAKSANQNRIASDFHNLIAANIGLELRINSALRTRFVLPFFNQRSFLVHFAQNIAGIFRCADDSGPEEDYQFHFMR
jgi:hypothetical protein